MKELEDELLDYGTQMTKRHPRSQPTWTDVKAKLADLDRTNLMGLVQDLYAAHKDNPVSYTHLDVYKRQTPPRRPA